jgi:hypothetical protein
MASNIDPSISLGGRPPPAMTLPQMLDMARSAQAYQQAQQVFPEQVEQARIATRTAQTQEQQAMFSLSQNQNKALMGIVGGYRNDPRIASGNPDSALAALDEIKAQAVAAGIPRSLVEQIGTTATSIAINNPKALPQYIDNVIQSQAGAEIQQSLQTPEIVEAGNQPGVYRRGSGTVETLPLPGSQPAASAAAAPAAAAPAADPPPRGVTGQDMTAPIRQAPAPAATDPTNGKMVQPTTERLPLIHPVRKAGVPFARLDEEETDRKTGSDLRNNLVQRQSELVTARRNLQEVIKKAGQLEEESLLPETGPIGAIKRGVANWIGDPTYKQLAKDLANVQISNIKAMGGSMDTVNGQNLIKMASGDETFPPSVLLDIARRADADITNLDMMATGMQRHFQKFGDNNAKRFQQMWSANADSRIFELMNISRDIKDPQKRQEYAEKLLGNLDETQRQDLFRKYNNVVKLSKTGDL